MTTFQKIIKALAIALAVFIIYIIATTIIQIVLSVAGISSGIDNMQRYDSYQEYALSDVSKIDLDAGAENIEIIKSDKLAVEAKGIRQGFKCEAKGGTLVISEKSTVSKIINFNTSTKAAEILIYVPENITFESVKLNTGAGNTKVEYINTKVLDIDSGAGNVTLDNVTTTEKVKIDSGVGQYTITNSVLANLDFDSGVGQTNIEAIFKGACKIDAGVGEIQIKMNYFNSQTDKITVEKDLGELKVNSQSYNGTQTFGEGTENTLSIDGGVGSIIVNY